MSEYRQMTCRVSAVNEEPGRVFDVILETPGLSCQVGQFAHVLVPGHTLRRPISICDSDGESIRLVFQVRGEGTELLSKTKKGQTLDILAPLGKGFPLFEAEKKVLLAGGGIGVPPLLGLAKHYGKNAHACLGFRNSEAVILTKDFTGYGARLDIATEDGSLGHNGFVTELFDEDYDCIYACGPHAMLKAVSEFAKRRSKPCYISLEERMACGVGACLGCAVGILDGEGKLYYGSVCKDGPVFDCRVVEAYR